MSAGILDGMDVHMPFLRERLSVVIDIGSGSTSVCFLSTRPGSPSRIIAQTQSKLDEEQHQSVKPTATSERTREALAHAVELAKLGHRRVDEAYCIIHPPSAESSGHFARRKLAAPAVITKELIGEVARESIASSRVLDDPSLFETAVTAIWLNGYPVGPAVGKSAADVAVSSIVSTRSIDIKRNIEAAVHEHFPTAEIFWRSNVRAIMSSLERGKPAFDSYLAVEIGADSTHIISIRDRQIEQQIVIPEGTRAIVRRLAGVRPSAETFDLLRAAARGACDEDACAGLEKRQAAAEPELARIFGEAFGTMASERRVSNDLLLFGTPGLNEWLVRFFTRIDFSQFTVTALPFSVRAFDATMVAKFIATDESVDGSLLATAALVNMALSD